jgi:hypothetical protein
MIIFGDGASDQEVKMRDSMSRKEKIMQKGFEEEMQGEFKLLEELDVEGGIENE